MRATSSVRSRSHPLTIFCNVTDLLHEGAVFKGVFPIRVNTPNQSASPFPTGLTALMLIQCFAASLFYFRQDCIQFCIVLKAAVKPTKITNLIFDLRPEKRVRHLQPIETLVEQAFYTRIMKNQNTKNSSMTA